MGTKTVRLDEQVYERIRQQKRPDETFSEAIDRLLGGSSLAELGDIFDDSQVEEMREAIEKADEADAEEVADVRERFDDR
ncbi:antitoxin VapB family protein [Natronomonas sp. EA1]|uniref:antitoxin VapB family protein n=1 Tax=Natronomonas sp. EA1 TaxID=3421655 RepID=UPI003EBAABA6